MAGEIKLNNVSIATENAGTVTINNATLGNSMVLGTTASPIANNLVFANGNGIDFSAAAGSASGSSSAVLDDYEEGAWTPTFFSSTNLCTGFTVNSAKYKKIGSLVWIGCELSLTGGTGNSTTGDTLVMQSIPFSANPDGVNTGTCWSSSSWATGSRVHGKCMIVGDKFYSAFEYASGTSRVNSYRFAVVYTV